MMVGLVLLLGSLFLYFQFVQSAYQNVQGLKAKLLSEEAFLRDEADVIGKVKTLISSYQGQAQIRDAISTALPLKEDVAGAIAQVAGISEQSSIDIVSITVSTIPPPTKKAPAGTAAASSAPKQRTFQGALQKPIGNFSLRISLTGGYESLKSFLSYLETNLLIFDVKSISVKPASAASNAKADVQDLFEFEVAVTTYYQGQ